MKNLITFSSDFGFSYPGAVKGTILKRIDANLIDISHRFPRGDVRTAAFWLREILPQFPECVHIVVIDPGVGTSRKLIVVRSGGHVLIGPDNGVLFPVAERLGNANVFEIIHKEIRDKMVHLRDIFAHTAADICEIGIENIENISNLKPIDSFEEILFSEPKIKNRSIDAEILVIDEFGNLITNVPGEIFKELFEESVRIGKNIIPIKDTYAEVEIGECVAMIGDHKMVELAINGGRGDRFFKIGIKDKIELYW